MEARSTTTIEDILTNVLGAYLVTAAQMSGKKTAKGKTSTLYSVLLHDGVPVLLHIGRKPWAGLEQ